MEAVQTGDKLMEAIASADESTLRAVLRGLCAKREVEQLIGKHFYELNKFSAAKGGSSGSKRKATSPVHICVECGQAFEEDDNKKECRYHLEEMEFDENSSIWADYDENCFGVMDSEENRRNPDTLGGFVYPCCNKRADEAEGCKLGYHRAVDGKRGRFDFDASADEKDEGEDDEEQKEDE
ncbi:hypothetical protein NEUTE1DRAFT_117062 [Neurospora tetrasperma FGSC 2508]|uniref:C2H2-type domain-containing protein n=1 Tax=Neurospora tetrasperma (strain FGSC 2508 / ATCC MYA-4615 / P0657) TaxID=510951 RepID=F8MJT1_NEUT8|nr:uncharacterized protein NEUTE1DRAFT_117062 [Neurospora tetrasperma FGSC 2508]EGO58118.1 hypothetical protein NEUTE1DRAFT_117062 [Neurospora tetrasperma FGSC 2508]EGZ71573.1 hypothetical protein NEUTE2DRAFT_144547 [Neurospora tetrasperma FGSC 2509]